MQLGLASELAKVRVPLRPEAEVWVVMMQKEDRLAPRPSKFCRAAHPSPKAVKCTRWRLTTFLTPGEQAEDTRTKEVMLTCA